MQYNQKPRKAPKRQQRELDRITAQQAKTDKLPTRLQRELAAIRDGKDV